jgi:hypothetical protein
VFVSSNLSQLVRNSATTVYEILPQIARMVASPASGKAIFDVSRLSELPRDLRRRTSVAVISPGANSAAKGDPQDAAAEVSPPSQLPDVVKDDSNA